MTVKELAEKMHISVRTLHYYDEIGLLKPDFRTEQGFRAYDDHAMERLKMILGFRELGFPLKEIGTILSLSADERDQIIEKQIEALEKQRQRIENRIALARGVQMLGSRGLRELDMHDLDEQMELARKNMEQNAALQLFKKKTKDCSQEKWEEISHELIRRFAAVGTAEDAQIKTCILDFARFIDEYFFPCDDRILMNYAKMFGGDGIFGRETDAAGGAGTAEKACGRIIAYIERKE